MILSSQPPAASHPSFYALDLYHQTLTQRGDEASVPHQGLQQHVAHCPQCLAHLQSLTLQDEPRPMWLSQLEIRPKSSSLGARLQSLGRWLAGLSLGQYGLGGATVAIAMVAVLYGPLHGLISSPTEPLDEAMVRSKGAARVSLYVKRGEQVTLWDEQSPLRPGDSIRLALPAGQLRHIWIARSDRQGHLQSLYQDDVMEKQSLHFLPVSWQLDDEPGEEVLYVVRALHPVDPQEATQWIAQMPPQIRQFTLDQRHLTRLVIPKRQRP